MKKAKSLLYTLIFMAVVVAVAIFVVDNYSFIFSRHIRGEIIDVARVAPPMAIVNSANSSMNNDAMFSFAVAIRDEEGTIHTASSEDRQFAVVHPGICVDAVFYPYPIWNLEKRGTYMNARLKSQFDCPPGMKHHTVEAPIPSETPAQLAAPAPTAAPAQAQ